MRKLTQEEFIKLCKIKNNNFYDYDKTIYINKRLDITVTCPIHGDFECNANNHRRGHGCYKCGIDSNGCLKRNNIKDMEERLKLIHNNKYVYNFSEYKNTHSKIKIICPKHGEFQQTYLNHSNGQDCPQCKSSAGELAIRSALISQGLKFTPQKRFPGCKDKLELPFDFYLDDYNICIEYQGSQHYEPKFGKKNFEYTKSHDKLKKDFCKNNNIKLIEIHYKEFKNIKNILKDLIC
jgi:hypothetical protein